jgi:hypothetical protein
VQVRATMVTGVRHNEQPGDLEAGEGAHVTMNLLYVDQSVLITIDLNAQQGIIRT